MNLSHQKELAKAIGFDAVWVDRFMSPNPPWLREHTLKAMAEDDALWRDFLEELIPLVQTEDRQIFPEYGIPVDRDNPLSAPQTGYFCSFAGLTDLILATPDQISQAAYAALKHCGIIKAAASAREGE